MKPSKLFALHKDVQPAEYVIESDTCTLGRYDECQVIVRHQTISRFHAKIECDGPLYLLSDTNSANGTFVNGQRIYEPYLLMDKDEIGLASPTALLRFEDPDSTVPLFGRLRYNEQAMRFFLNNEPIDLTLSQFRLLHHLYQQAGNVCTRESCAEAIWGREYDPGLDAAAFDRAISKLRRQLHDIDPKTNLIRTRRGVGYVLHP